MSLMKQKGGMTLTKAGLAATVAILLVGAACTTSPSDTATPPGWSRVEIERTYSIALPPGVEQRRYGHPEGSMVLFKGNGFLLDIGLLHSPVGEVPPVADLNTTIDGRPAHVDRLPNSTGSPELPFGFQARTGDIGNESTFVMISANCRDVAAQDTAEKIVRSMRFLPLRPRRDLPPIPDPPGR